jgi:hypothetical protein
VHPCGRWWPGSPGSMLTYMIEVEHVTKRYGEKVAVDDL